MSSAATAADPTPSPAPASEVRPASAPTRRSALALSELTPLECKYLSGEATDDELRLERSDPDKEAAVRELRLKVVRLEARSLDDGTDELTDEEIEAEIAAVRAKRIG